MLSESEMQKKLEELNYTDEEFQQLFARVKNTEMPKDIQGYLLQCINSTRENVNIAREMGLLPPEK